jgi:hypothetical protein
MYDAPDMTADNVVSESNKKERKRTANKRNKSSRPWYSDLCTYTHAAAVEMRIGDGD